MPKPTFIGIGGHRSGSTFLHKILEKHPHVVTPKSGSDRFGKELRFFVHGMSTHDIPWYENQFLTDAYDDTKAVGEVDPSYTMLPRFFIRRIRSYLGPNLKIIYIIRDPVARVLSHKKMQMTRYNTNEPNSSKIKLLTIVRSCQKENFIRKTRLRAIYKRWSSIFGSNQIYVIYYDNLINNTYEEVANLCKFLGVPYIKSVVPLNPVHESRKDISIDPIVYEYLSWKWQSEIKFVSGRNEKREYVNPTSNIPYQRIVLFNLLEALHLPLRGLSAFGLCFRMLKWAIFTKKLAYWERRRAEQF